MKQKELYFLEYNKGNIATDLIQAEVHFRKLNKTGGGDSRGHANCVVKHLLHAHGESLESVSHALVLGNPGESHSFRSLGANIEAFRKRLQTENVSPDEGILAVRKLRGQFESFNPEFDVSKCRSCGSVDGFGDLIKDANNLNTETNDNGSVDDNMAAKNNLKGKDIAVLYGGQWVGLGADKAIDMVVPQYGLAVKLGLAVLLPILAYSVKMNNTLAEVAVLAGGYLSTKLPDYAPSLLPVARVRNVMNTAARRVATASAARSDYGTTGSAYGAQTKYSII